MYIRRSAVTADSTSACGYGLVDRPTDRQTISRNDETAKNDAARICSKENLKIEVTIDSNCSNQDVETVTREFSAFFLSVVANLLSIHHVTRPPPDWPLGHISPSPLLGTHTKSVSTYSINPTKKSSQQESSIPIFIYVSIQ
jgi:hypothetical protein